MSSSAEFLYDVFVVSFLFWIFYGIYSIFIIKKFIIRRYENETNLLDTIYFKEHFTIVKVLPDFFSAGIYAIHVISCAWGWRIYGDRKIFRDISTPERVLKNFSRKELWMIKRVFVIVFILLLHFITFSVLQFN